MMKFLSTFCITVTFMYPSDGFSYNSLNSRRSSAPSCRRAIDLSSVNLDGISSSIVQSDLLPTGLFDSLRDDIFEISKKGGPPIMTLAVALSDTIPLVPTQPISIIAGALFGIKFGLPAVIVGQAVATTLALLFGRYVLSESEWSPFDSSQENNKNKMKRVFDELTSGLNSEDFKTVFGTIFLARQSPILPFSVGNYFVGAATKAPLLPVVAATVLGCLPINTFLVGAGAGGMAAVDFVKENGVLAEGFEAIGAFVTLGFILVAAKTILSVFAEDEQAENTA